LRCRTRMIAAEVITIDKYLTEDRNNWPEDRNNWRRPVRTEQ
jgi:hypothetical protein